MALGADALYVACMFTNNVVRVNLGTWKVDGAAPAGAGPVDIKFYGDKLYVAAAGSSTLEIIDAATLQPIKPQYLSAQAYYNPFTRAM
jgi:DNA-binding beta-propeller fold protein YncE